MGDLKKSFRLFGRKDLSFFTKRAVADSYVDDTKYTYAYQEAAKVAVAMAAAWKKMGVPLEVIFLAVLRCLQENFVDVLEDAETTTKSKTNDEGRNETTFTMDHEKKKKNTKIGKKSMD